MQSVMLNKALSIAYEAHEKQVDKAGAPYILHPMRVALHCKTEEEKVVALLHDVLEDSPMTLEDLKSEGFNEEILEALKCLTKIKGEDYRDFIQRIVLNPLATRVKIQDLKDKYGYIPFRRKATLEIGFISGGYGVTIRIHAKETKCCKLIVFPCLWRQASL